MSGLKSYIPELAHLLNRTPAALYERQRVLVKLLEAVDVVPGRGPGSGVRINSRTVTLLVIAVLATDALGETYDQTITVGAAKSTAGKCPLTNMVAFSHALAAILSQDSIAVKVVDLKVSRTIGVITLRYRSGRKILMSEFKTSQAKKATLTIDATLAGPAIHVIARGLESRKEQ